MQPLILETQGDHWSTRKGVQSVEDLHRLLDENMIDKMVNLMVLRNNIKTKVQVIAGELK